MTKLITLDENVNLKTNMHLEESNVVIEKSDDDKKGFDKSTS